jgi:hypothetical protein
MSTCAVNTVPQLHQQRVPLVFGVCNTCEGFDSITVTDDPRLVT